MSLTIINRTPDANETGVDKNINFIDFSIVSTSKVSLTNVTVNGLTAVINGVVYPPFNGPGYFKNGLELMSAQIDYRLDYTGAPFDDFTNIYINIQAEDDLSDSIDETYYFRTKDIEAPLFSLISPENGAVNQSRDVIIEALIYDRHSGIDVSTIEVYVDGYIAYDGEYFYIPFDGPLSSFTPVDVGGYDGYQIIIDRAGLYTLGSNIEVLIKANDNDGN